MMINENPSTVNAAGQGINQHNLDAAGDPIVKYPLLTQNAIELLHRRYLQGGEDPESMFRRVATAVAKAERTRNEHQYVRAFYHLLRTLDFLPNTPTLVHAGRGTGHCLSACFVDSPHDSLDSITQVGRDMAAIESSGGGTGFGMSRIRPYNDKIGTRPSGSCGPIRVIHNYSSIGNTFTQGAVRQGAHMAQLHISHPDIVAFIHAKDGCKNSSDPLFNFNISVQIPDSFMEALTQENVYWQLINPRTGGMVGDAIKCQDLWDSIVSSAHRTGDPGVVFIDRVHESDPCPHLGQIESSNPCLLGSTRMLTLDGLIPIDQIGVGRFARPVFGTPSGWSKGSAWKSGNNPKPIQLVVLSYVHATVLPLGELALLFC